MMTDWKALCAELLGELENEGHAHWPGGPDGDPLIEQTRAALAAEADGPAVPDGREPASVVGEPSNRVPTLNAIMQLADNYFTFRGNSHGDSFFATSIEANKDPAQSIYEFARAVLARYGHHPTPVPVSERLPGPEDCDAEGNIWAWRRFDLEGDIKSGDFWCLAFCEWLEDEDCGYTHWLPFTALPLPQGEVQP